MDLFLLQYCRPQSETSRFILISPTWRPYQKTALAGCSQRESRKDVLSIILCIVVSHFIQIKSLLSSLFCILSLLPALQSSLHTCHPFFKTHFCEENNIHNQCCAKDLLKKLRFLWFMANSDN